jgi:small subunit ribosomal protein S21
LLPERKSPTFSAAPTELDLRGTISSGVALLRRTEVMTMSGVRVREGEPFERALRRFRRTVERSGVLKELRRRQYYEKPSVRSKKKSLAARKRSKKLGREA